MVCNKIIQCNVIEIRIGNVEDIQSGILHLRVNNQIRICLDNLCHGLLQQRFAPWNVITESAVERIGQIYGNEAASW